MPHAGGTPDVSIAKNKAILFGDNVGVTLKNALNARRELLQ